MKYVFALLACFGVFCFYCMIAVALGWQHGGGAIPTLVLIAAITATWRKITKRKTHEDSQEINLADPLENPISDSKGVEVVSDASQVLEETSTEHNSDVNHIDTCAKRLTLFLVISLSILGIIALAIMQPQSSTAEEKSAHPESPTSDSYFDEVLIKAKGGDADAQFDLAWMYYDGQSVTQDYKEAVKWYIKAAEQGVASAQFSLGLMYGSGQGVPQNDKEAVRWFSIAAEQGYAEAQFSLGLMYGRGQAVPQNDKEAAKWWTKAAEQGHANAQFFLGAEYSSGRGVPQNDKEAAKWYTKAAEQGVASAQGNLGVMYLEGQGVIEDYIEAYKWFLIAAANGNENVMDIKRLLREELTRNQIEEAQRLAKKFKPQKK